MKINKIAKICKDSGDISVMETVDGPWIGTINELYFVPELQNITEAGIYSIFNISETKQRSYPISYIDREKENIDISDYSKTTSEIMLQKGKMQIAYGNELYQPFIGTTSNGEVIFVMSNPSSFSPLPDNLDVFLRGKKIIVKKGMIAQAVITPVTYFYDGLIAELNFTQKFLTNYKIEGTDHGNQ